MGTLVMIEFLTVDGVMQGLGSPGEDPEGGFVHGGWGAPYAESVHQVTASSGFARTSSYLFGRRTYEGMAAYWPTSTDAIAGRMNAIPKIVFSSTLADALWANTTLEQGDAVAAVEALKRQDGGDLFVFGSAELSTSLGAAGLFDEYRIAVAPVILGSGSPLFGRGQPQRTLRLIESRSLASGGVVLRYQPSGD